jgi:hypothetical protein
MTDGGEGSNGVIYTNNRREAVRIRNINYWSNNTNKEIMSIRMKRYYSNQENLDAMIASRKEYYSIKENRDKQSLRRKGKKESPEQIARKYKAVISTNLTTKEELEWISGKEAAEVLNINKNSIVACCKGRHRKAGNYKFRYK